MTSTSARLIALAMNANRVASQTGTCAALTDPYTAKNTHRVRDGEEIGLAITEALGVIEALTEPTSITCAHGYRREPGALAQMTPTARAKAIWEAAREVAHHTIPTHYANSGGTRAACADRIAEAVLIALLDENLLANVTLADFQ